MEYALQVQCGHTGWLQFNGPATGVPGALYVRYEPDRRGRMRAREVYIDGDGDVLESLRKVPLDQLEATANQLAHEGMLQPNVPSPADGLSVLASHHSTHFGSQASDSNWVARAYFAQTERSGPRRKPIRASGPPSRPMFVGPGPDGLTDEFLTRLADSYYYEVSMKRSPAKALATEASVSPKTVHKWVRLARDRGIMPPARKGVAG